MTDQSAKPVHLSLCGRKARRRCAGFQGQKKPGRGMAVRPKSFRACWRRSCGWRRKKAVADPSCKKAWAIGLSLSHSLTTKITGDRCAGLQKPIVISQSCTASIRGSARRGHDCQHN